jgi:outer membrane translocation and assembly module TamA
VALQRIFGKYHSFTLAGNYQMVRVLADEPNHFVTNTIPSISPVFQKENYAGAGAAYDYHNLNNEVLPTKGFNFHTGASHTQSLEVSNENFERLDASTGIYLPLGRLLTLAIKGGGSTLTGAPAFYHLATIGGGQSLRGFRRERFRGRSAVYNQNELRLSFDTNSIFFNGKMGVLAFIDDGRVWTANDISDKWHVGYGGGFFFSPFNKFALGVNYGISEEGRVFHIKFGKML